jgi:oligopeptide transport system ATP-binding protein
LVYGNTAEIEDYRAIREKNEPLKSITIDESYDTYSSNPEADVLSGSNFILDTPVHDTGSGWYTFGSFLLPVIGLIAGLIFKKNKYIKNFKACKRGAIAGLITLGTVVGLFLLLLLLAII